MYLSIIVHQIFAQQQGQNIELFRKTSLILSGQVPFDDCRAQGNSEATVCAADLIMCKTLIITASLISTSTTENVMEI